MGFWKALWSFGSLALPNMFDTIIISVAEQVKRWPLVTLQALAYSLLAVEILLP
jgi:hypothetical protein